MNKTMRKRTFSLIILGIAAVIAISLFGAIEVTSQPGFCNSCHYMNSFYKQWKSSSHNKVACVKCHYPPGLKHIFRAKLQAINQVVAYFTKTYSTRAYAEVEDASCLRNGCHQTRLLDTVVYFKHNIKFNHKHHLGEIRRGKKLRCTSCHGHMVMGEHIAVTESVCFLCHFKGLVDGIHPMGQSFCTKCHAAPEKDIQIGDITYNHADFVNRGVPCQNCHLSVVRGTGKADRSRCYACHAEKDRLAHFDDHQLMHQKHVTDHKVDCNRCHEEIAHSVKTTSTPLEFSCNICHRSTHNGTKELFMGTGGKGIPPMPSHMFKVQVNCIGCHVAEQFPEETAQFTGQTMRPSEKGCIKCHGSDVEGMLETWKTDISKALNVTAGLIAKAEVKTMGPRASDETRKIFSDAKYNYNFVKFAKGIHNVEYATALLEYSNTVCTKIIEGK